MTERCTLAIGAIVKEEAPYLIEWIAFHRAAGVERFFLADNGGADGMSDLLAALQAVGLVTHFPFPTPPGGAPQLPAFAEILARHGNDAEWIAFVDADEFLVSRDVGVRLVALLDSLGEDVGRAVVNWKIYGSSHIAEAAPGLVIERFTKHARRTDRANRHYKSIVRPEAVAGLCDNPHAFELKPGFLARRIDGSVYEEARPLRLGVSVDVVWAPVRLNHYVVKSRQEFVERKVPKGRADRRRKLRTEAYYQTFDLNDVEEPMDPALIGRTRREIDRIVELLAGGGAPANLLQV